jgi:hypothetical protein
MMQLQENGLLYTPQVNPYGMGMEWMDSIKLSMYSIEWVMDSTFIPSIRVYIPWNG